MKKKRQEPADAPEDTSSRLKLVLKRSDNEANTAWKVSSTPDQLEALSGKSKRASVLNNLLGDVGYYKKEKAEAVPAENAPEPAAEPSPSSGRAKGRSHAPDSTSPPTLDEPRPSRKRKSTLDPSAYVIPPKIQRMNEDKSERSPEKKAKKKGEKPSELENKPVAAQGSAEGSSGAETRRKSKKHRDEGGKHHANGGKEKMSNGEEREKHRHHNDGGEKSHNNDAEKSKHKEKHSKHGDKDRAEKEGVPKEGVPDKPDAVPKLKIKFKLPVKEGVEVLTEGAKVGGAKESKEDGASKETKKHPTAVPADTPSVLPKPQLKVKVKLPDKPHTTGDQRAAHPAGPNGIPRKSDPDVRRHGNISIKKPALPVKPPPRPDFNAPVKKEVSKKDVTTATKKHSGKSDGDSKQVATGKGDESPEKGGELPKKRTGKTSDYDNQVVNKFLAVKPRSDRDLLEHVGLEKRRPKPKVFMEDEDEELTPRRERKVHVEKAPVEDAATLLKKSLTNVLAQVMKIDRTQIFLNPVTEEIAPGYFSVVSKPMDFKAMRKKIKQGAYPDFQTFQADLDLICNNCMIYNGPETVFYKLAKRLHVEGKRLVANAVAESKQDIAVDKEKVKEKGKAPAATVIESQEPKKRLMQPIPPPKLNLSVRPLPTTPYAPSNSSTPKQSPVTFPLSNQQFGNMSLSDKKFNTPIGAKPNYMMSPTIDVRAPTKAHINSALAAIGSHLGSMHVGGQFPQYQQHPQLPPRPQAGRPGQRPPVVELMDNQATQTQSLYTEQPKRKYVKVTNDEPVKPAATSAKPPAIVQTAKIGTTPLVSPMNAAAIPLPSSRSGESVPSPSDVSTPTLTEIEKDLAEDEEMRSVDTTEKEEGTPEPMEITPTTSADTDGSTTTSSSPTETTQSSSSAISTPIALKQNYCNNYVSIPVVHQAKPPPPPQPEKPDANDEEIFSSALQYFIGAIDIKGRAELVGFLDSLKHPEKAVDRRAIWKPTHAPVPKPAPAPAPAAAPAQVPLAPTFKVEPTLPHHKPSSIAHLLGNIDQDLLDEVRAMDDTELTPEDLQELQVLKSEGFDLDFLDPFISNLPRPRSTPVPAPISTVPAPTPPVGSALGTVPTSPPVGIEQEILTSSPSTTSFATPASPTQTLTTTTTSTTTTTAEKSAGEAVSVKPADKVKVTQEVLDRNFELLCSLQLCQYERPASGLSELEFNLATELSNNLVHLGGVLQPQQLVSKEALYNTLHYSGLQSMSTSSARNRS